MFKIDENPSFWNKVEWQFPEEEPVNFKAKFKVQKADQLEGIKFDEPGSSERFLKDTIIGVDDVIDRDGKPQKCTEEFLDELLKWPHIRAALFRSYYAGSAAAIRGN